MAYAKICDRCKNVYAKNNFVADFGDNKHGTVKGVCVMFEETDRKRAGSNHEYTEVHKNAYLDLCDDCGKLLNNFLAMIDIYGGYTC